MSDLHTRIWAAVRIELRAHEPALPLGEANRIAARVADKLLMEVIPRTTNELASYEGWPIRIYHETGYLRFREVDTRTQDSGQE